MTRTAVIMPSRSDRPRVKTSMGFIHRTTFRAIATVLLVAVALTVLWLGRRVFIAFLLAIFFAYLLEPVVGWFTRRFRGRRNHAIVATYAVFLMGLGLFVATVGPKIVSEAERLVQSLPSMVGNVSSGQIAMQFGGQHGWSFETQVRLQRLLAAHKDEILQHGRDTVARVAGVLSNVAWILLIPVLAFFFLKNKSSFGLAAIHSSNARRDRSFIRTMIRDLDSMLARYIRAQLILTALAAVVYTAFLLIMRVPYGLALGVIGGLLEFIPFVGPALTAVLIVGVAILTGYKHWLVLLIFLAVWRMLQDYVTTPYVMGAGLELHPLLAIFGILIGGEIAGVIGMFLSIPVMAALRIFWRNWQQKQEASTTLVNESPFRDSEAA